MSSPESAPAPARSSHSFLPAMLRALSVTVTSSALAVALLAWRRQLSSWSQIAPIVRENAPLFGAIFLAMTVWNYLRSAPLAERCTGEA